IPFVNEFGKEKYDELFDNVCKEIAHRRMGYKYISDLQTGSKTAFQYHSLAEIDIELQSNSNNADLWFEKAGIHHDRNEYHEAMRAIRNAYRLEPRLSHIILGYAAIMADYGCFTKDTASRVFLEAIRLFESVRSDFGDALIDYNIGRTYGCLDDIDNSLQYYDSALESNPLNELAAQIWVNKGNTMAEMGIEDSATSFEKAISLNPELFQAHQSLGAYYRRHDNFSEAKSSFDIALEISPKVEQEFRFSYWYADVLYNLNDFGNAVEWLDKITNPSADEVKHIRHLKFYIYHEQIENTADISVIQEALTFYDNWLKDTFSLDDESFFLIQQERAKLFKFTNNKNKIDDIIVEITKRQVNPENMLNMLSLLAEIQYDNNYYHEGLSTVVELIRLEKFNQNHWDKLGILMDRLNLFTKAKLLDELYERIFHHINGGLEQKLEDDIDSFLNSL
ncbi:MAG: tetratricopeptide repeat protein, partial [Chloroflexota bacterium]